MKPATFLHLSHLSHLALDELLPSLMDSMMPQIQALIVSGCTRGGHEEEALHAKALVLRLMALLEVAPSHLIIIPNSQDLATPYCSKHLFQSLKGTSYRCSETQAVFLPPGLQLVSLHDHANGIPGINEALFRFHEGQADQQLSGQRVHRNFTRMMVHQYPMAQWLRNPDFNRAARNRWNISLSHEAHSPVAKGPMCSLWEREPGFSVYHYEHQTARMIRAQFVRYAGAWFCPGTVQIPIFCAEVLSSGRPTVQPEDLFSTSITAMD